VLGERRGLAGIGRRRLRQQHRRPEPRRIGFDLGRVMRTRYKIDSFQQTYFVIDDFAQLFRETAPDFTPLYRQIAAQPQLDADALLPDDRVYR
jgi:phenylalanine-4-hydroxylase